MSEEDEILEHSKQVIVTESSGKIHDLKEADNWHDNWKLITGCNFTITDGRLMSLTKAKNEGFELCKNCFDEEPESQDEDAVEVITLEQEDSEDIELEII